jgi:restriction system protein
MREGTITWAIANVLQKANRPLAAREIYELIVADDLYSFKAENPIHVVYTQIRRHCE